MSLVQKSLQAPPFHPEGLEQAETCPPHHGHHRGAHRGQACWELTVCSLLFRGGLCVLQVEYQPGTCFLKHNDHSSIFIGQRSSHFEILTPKASPWTGITLPLPTGVTNRTCTLVGHSTAWEPWIIHESVCEPEGLKEGWRPQSKCVHVFENPELSLDLQLHKIKDHLRMATRGRWLPKELLVHLKVARCCCHC